jgi:phosphoserine phosphatase RsbU/P
MIRQFQRLSASIMRRKAPGVILGTALLAALMALTDTFFLVKESSLFYGVSLGFTSLIKISVAALFGGLFASWFPIRTKSDDADMLVPVEPYKLLRRGGLFVLFSSLVIIAGAVSVGITVRDSEDVLIRFCSAALGLLFVAVIVRELQWLDTLLQIRRTRFTARFRVIAMMIGIVTIVMQVFSVMTKVNTNVAEVLAMALLGVMFLISSSRISWISSFSKDQKWRAFGISFAALTASIGVSVSLESSDRVIKFLEILLPGARNFSMFASVLSSLFFLRLSFSLGLSLPTAAIVDRKINEVRSLAYLSRTISQVYDLERLLGIVTTMIRDVCGATSSWVELEDSETHTLSIVAQLRISQQELQSLYKDGILRTVLARQGSQALHFEALDEEPGFMPVAPYTADFAQSLIAVPLFLDNKRIGTVFAAHKEKFIFEMEDISLLSAFANNISIAIENVRLFENSLEQERFKREMLLAREMQQKLLPKQTPTLQAFTLAAYASPAMEVGGDYYDYVRLKSGLPCVIIGDVSGKGITAAFYMAELKGIVLAVAPESDSPHDLLCRINAALYGNMERGSYIAMTAVALSEGTMVEAPISGMPISEMPVSSAAGSEAGSERCELIIARAGHTPIALTRSGKVSMVQPRGLGVALVGAEKFCDVLEEIRIPMLSGDVCLLFTDGVNEAVNAERDEFGMEPLHTVLAKKNPDARFIIAEIVQRVSEFSEGLPQHDDLTVIAIVAGRPVVSPILNGANTVQFLTEVATSSIVPNE